MKKILTVLSLIIVFIHGFSEKARAFSTPPCGPPGTGAIYAMEPAVISSGQFPIVGAFGTGSITITPFLSGFIPWVEQLVDCSQQAIVTAIMAHAQSQQMTAQETQKAGFQRSLMSFQNQALLEKTKEFGNSFIPPGTCAHDVATSYAGGVSAYAVQIGQTVHANTDAYDTIRPTQPQTLKTLVSQPPAAFSSASFFGSDDLGAGTTLTPAQVGLGANYINNVTHPIPFSPLPQSKTNTADGQKQYLIELSDNSALSMAHHALSQVLALRMANPTALKTWDSYMEATTENTALQNPGQVSMMRLFGDSVASRFMNHSWYKMVANYPVDKVQRENAETNALNSELLYQILVGIQNIESLEAVRLSRTIKQQ